MIRRFALGAALGAFFLWLALRNVSFREIAVTLERASVPAFLLFVLMHVSALFIRAARWRLLLRPLADIPARLFLAPLSIGFMVNFLLPGRAGVVVRVWLLGRREPVKRSTASVFGGTTASWTRGSVGAGAVSSVKLEGRKNRIA